MHFDLSGETSNYMTFFMDFVCMIGVKTGFVLSTTKKNVHKIDENNSTYSQKSANNKS